MLSWEQPLFSELFGHFASLSQLSSAFPTWWIDAFKNDVEEMMSLSKTLWDQLLILGGGIGKEHQTCKHECSLQTVSDYAKSIAEEKGVPKAWHMPVINIFLFRFCLIVEMFCLNPDFWLLFTDSGTPFTCDGWMYPAEARAHSKDSFPTAPLLRSVHYLQLEEVSGLACSV